MHAAFAAIALATACQIKAPKHSAFSFSKNTDAAFFVGDSVIGQLCVLSTVPLCKNNTPLHAPGTWQHLVQHTARTENNATIPAFQVSARVCQSCTNIKAAQATAHFINARATPNSVLLLGLLGAHFQHTKDLDMYLQNLKFYLVDQFPGRTIKLGPVHQHFATLNNEFVRSAQCAQLTSSGKRRIDERELDFVAIMGTDAIKVSNITANAHDCHRNVAKGRQADCTHFANVIYDTIKFAAAQQSSALVPLN